MKGIILCGGTGSRLQPLTNVLNKHLLPLGKTPMILHPLSIFIKNEIRDVCILVGGNNIGDFIEFLGDGSSMGLSIYYRYQSKPFGIAHAINCCRSFVKDDDFTVVLGDNIFIPAPDLGKYYKGAKIYTVKCRHPEMFGVLQLKRNKIIDIKEKPKKYIGNNVILGLYQFNSEFFEYYKRLKPSRRGEYEITDILKCYLKDEWLYKNNYSGFWSDAGTMDTYHDVWRELLKRRSDRNVKKKE